MKEQNKKEETKLLQCVVGPNIRNVVNQANELGISREDIIQMFTLRDQVYLVYYK